MNSFSENNKSRPLYRENIFSNRFSFNYQLEAKNKLILFYNDWTNR